jgi:hypothetical protein
VKMDGSPPQSLTQYYKSARGLSTAIAAVFLPFASKIVGENAATYLFPPLGSMDGPARVGLVALCLGVSLGVYFLVAVNPVKSPTRMIWSALLVSAVCLFAYLAFYDAFIHRVEIPSRGTSLYVSVGYQRTEFAKQTFGSASDEEMLRARGPSEEEIRRLWTRQSLIIARLGLYSSCVLTTLSWLFVFSFALVRDMSVRKSGTEKK